MIASEATVKTAPKIASKLETRPSAGPALRPALKHIVLTGFMGAGKTTVGRLLANALGWDFLDLDAHLEARADATIPQLFARHGEPHFRRLESSALANALARGNTVLALGGGTPEQLTNRLLLEQTPGTLVIFLDAPFETLFDRCMLQSFALSGARPEHIRPVLASPAEARDRFVERQPHYRRLARLTISTADITPPETAEAILEHLAKLS
jgi:shikimate kinase